MKECSWTLIVTPNHRILNHISIFLSQIKQSGDLLVSLCSRVCDNNPLEARSEKGIFFLRFLDSDDDWPI